jgi:cobalt-zinc-cadmium efflux system outer membrane protein
MPGLRLLAFLTICATALPRIAAATPLDDLVATALRDNPRIVAARQLALAAGELPAQVSSLADPKVGIAWYLSEVETRVGPQEQRLFLSQSFPFWGTRALRGERAEGLAQAAAATVHDVALAVATEVKERYYDLAYVEESLRITEADRALVADIVEAALAHYGAGHGQQRDVLRAQVALSRDTDRLLTLRVQRTTLITALNELLARDKLTPIDGVALPEALPAVGTMAELRAEMVAARPRLAALNQRVAAARTAVDLARRQYYPDLTAAFDYTITGEGPLPVEDNGTDSYWATLSINLPIWRKRLAAGVSEARARVAALEASYRDELERAERELADLRFRLSTSLNQVALFDTGLVPQAEQALRATMDAYRTGNAGFLDLLDAERDWLELRLAAFRAKADLFQQQARLDQAVGRLPGETATSRK